MKCLSSAGSLGETVPEAPIFVNKEEDVMKRKLFSLFPSGKLYLSGGYPSKEHLVRKNWKGNPLRQEVMGLLCALYVSVWLAVVFVVVVIDLFVLPVITTMQNGRPLWWFSLLGTLLCTVCLFAAFINLIRSSDFFNEYSRVCTWLNLTPSEFAHASAERLQGLAEQNLKGLANRVVLVEQTAPPYSEYRDNVKLEFRAPFNGFKSLGLIPLDATYKRYFSQAV